MTVRTVPFTAALLVGLTAPCLADEAIVAPHELNLNKPAETESIAIQDLSGGVGSQDNSGGGSVIQILQIQPNGNTNATSTSASAPRFISR